jgi:hypothetical protein
MRVTSGGFGSIQNKMNPQSLKICGIALNVLGTIILAFRVTKILDAVRSVLTCHEANIQQLMEEATGTNQDHIINFANSTAQLEKARKLGAKLLVLAFCMIVVGNILAALALWLAAK